MADAMLAALYRGVGDALAADATVAGLVSTRIYADQAPASVARPYITLAWAAGGEINQSVAKDGLITLMVKGVAETMASAFSIAAAIDAVLDDADIASGGALDGGNNWEITYSNGGLLVHLVETADGIQIYHEGKRYEFFMQAK